MDEQEQADRLAAAEALYMISTRVDKSGTIQKSPRISRKKRNNDHDEDSFSSGKRKVVVVGGDGDHRDRAGGGRSRGRVRTSSVSGGGGSNRRGAGDSRGSGGSSRGRGGRGPSPRGRGAAGKGSDPLKSQQRQTVGEAIINHDNFKGHNNNGRYNKRNIIVGENVLPQHHGEDLKQKSKTRTPKVRQKTKLTPPPIDKDDVDCSQKRERDDGKVKVHHHQAFGFTGAAISLSDSLPKRSSYDSSQTLQSHGLVSGFKQVTLASQTLSSTTPLFSMTSMNLASFAPDVNLPSIPLEIGSLQLSSQPTPNLSSLGDLSQGALEDAFSFANRKKAEKFLPLKKRKLHSPSEPAAREEAPAAEGSYLSDSEERSELQSSPPPSVEPLRASFTVQAPPIITMQTLMEIKTALTADDDGDLPLHIAVVHENMRMVIKLITLMKIAGKGVDKFNKQQQTPLHLAVKLNFLEAVDILLKSSANVNAVDCTGSSCIHMAVQGRSTDCLTMLLERCPNADLNARNFDGLTPLHIAVDNGDLLQVETLLKYNADIDVTDGKSGRTALFWAAESNQKAMVELLLGKGANPDVPNYAGVTTAMAAQGRNLHGVLKLLGSVATDKFTEFDMKPSLESKPNPLYLGLPSSDNLALPHHSIARGISLSKHTGHGVTCLVEPKMSMETIEMPSDETKVFKNVFVLSQNHAKSMSEPSSPEVKMEVAEDKDDETYGPSGLMSLPEGIFSKTEDDRGAGHLGRQRKMVVTGLGGSLFTSRGKMQLPVMNSNVVKIAEPGLQRSEQKSVLVHVLHPFSKVGASAVAALASSPNVAQSRASNPSSEFGVSASKPASNASSVSSSTSPLSHLSSSNDTGTLTNMQARLFQLLLKKYNIDPSSEAATSSNDSGLLSTTLSSASPKWTSPAPSPLTTSLSVAAPYQQQGTQSYSMQSVQISGGSSVASHEQITECNGSASSFHHQTPVYQHEHMVVLGNHHNHTSENGIHMETEVSKPVESPLNLSTTSSRGDVRDGKSITSSKGKEGPAYARPPVYSSQSSLDGGSSTVVKVNPAQLGSLGKVISIDVHRVPEHARSDKVGREGTDQFEMFLVQEGQTQVPVTVASGHIASSGVTTLLRTQSEGNVPQIKPAAKQSDLKPLVETASDSSHITSVSQKTAFIVRDYLTQQKNHNFASQPVTTTASLSSVHASVPTVLELAADNSSSTHKKHVVDLARSPSAVVTVGKAASYASSSVASTGLLPTASTSPVFLHHGHVIDLSRSKGKEANSLTSSQSLPLSSGNSDAGQGKIIGFSGAVLSVAPSKLDQAEKRPPREATPKEFQKKRGRKSQKTLSGLTLAAEVGLGKINSETDEKLKKFLDAKKSESILSSAVDGMLGLQDEQANGVEGDMEESEACKVPSASQHSEGRIDKTYKTVGIFSGNIQHVKVGKKPTVSPSAVPTLPAALLLPLSSSLMLSPTLLSSHDIKSSDVDTSEVKSSECESRAENTGLTSPTIVSPCVTSETSKHYYIKMASIETAMSDTFDCKKNVSDDVSNYSSGCSDVKSKSVRTRLPADASAATSRESKKSVRTRLPADASAATSRESTKRTTKPPSSCVKGRTGALLNKKEARMQQSSAEVDSITRSSVVTKQTQKLERSGMKSKAGTVKIMVNIDGGVKAKGTNLPTKTSLEAAKWQEKDSGVCGSTQPLPLNGDSFSKHKKRQGRKRSGLQGKEQVSKGLPVVVSKQHPLGAQTPSTCDSHVHGLTSRVTVTSESRNVFSAELTDRRTERACVFSTDVADDDDDDDFGGEPALVIEETQQDMS